MALILNRALRLQPASQRQDGAAFDPRRIEACGQLEVVFREQSGVGQDVPANVVRDDASGGEDDRTLAQLGREGQVVRDDEQRRSIRSRTSRDSRRARGSRLADGSSRTSSWGSVESTVAIATRRRSPIES